MDRNNEHHKAALVFSAPLARLLSEEKIPPTSVGVRKLRACSKLVRQALKRPRLDGSENVSDNDKEANFAGRAVGEGCREDESSRGSDLQSTSDFRVQPMGAIMYKVVGNDGVERRMTKKEKKAHKKRWKVERAMARKALKEEKTQLTLLKNNKWNGSDFVLDTMQSGVKSKMPVESTCLSSKFSENHSGKHGREYYQLEVSSDAIEEELTQLRGEKGSVLPVILSASMVERAAQHGILQFENSIEKGGMDPPRDIIIDGPLSHAWAAAIKKEIQVAEDLRSLEDMRPMAYQVLPESWSRLKPQPLSAITSCLVPDVRKNGGESVDHVSLCEDPTGEMGDQVHVCDGEESPSESKETDALGKDHRMNWSLLSTRSAFSDFDTSSSVIYECLHRFSNLHISCGAKFGCDFLLYDGPREERHAFAGLKVCCCNESSRDGDQGKNMRLPIPSAYDLAGYVRALNTAGKLALLAMVNYDQEGGCYLVSFVDLALEKVLSAPTHQKKRSRGVSIQKRKEIGANLAKKK